MANKRMIRSCLLLACTSWTFIVLRSAYILHHPLEIHTREEFCEYNDTGTFHCYVPPACIPSDSEVLLEFKEDFLCADFSNRYIDCPFDTWVTGTDCCNGWSGVGCDATGQVSHLSVNGFWDGSPVVNFQIFQAAPSATFMTQLPRLKGLKSINIRYTSFKDAQLPSVWGQIANLRGILIVGVDGLTGEIPKDFGKLTNLEYFVLDGNSGPSLSGTNGIPEELCNLHKLRKFSVGRFPNWSGTLPACIDGWTSIQSITIANGDLYYGGEVLETGGLTGPLPSSLGNLKTLEDLDLVGNKFTGAIPSSFGNLIKLRALRLSHNQLSGEAPWKELWKLKDLVKLDLSFNYLYGSLPPFLPEEFTCLEYLDVGNNDISGEIPSRMFELPKLYNLRLRNNRFEGRIPWSDETNIKCFNYDFSYNFLSGPLPRLPGDFGYFQASHNQFIGNIPASYRSLKSLDLSFNRLSGEVPSDLLSVGNLCLDENDFANYTAFSSDRLIRQISDPSLGSTCIDMFFLHRRVVNASCGHEPSGRRILRRYNS